MTSIAFVTRAVWIVWAAFKDFLSCTAAGEYLSSASVTKHPCLLTAGISPCCCTRQPSIGYAMQWCTELFALDFNDLCRIKLWILSLLAHTEIHYLHCAQVSPVLFGFKSFALHNGCNALQSDCNAQSDNCLFFSTFQFIVCYRTTQPHSFQRYFSQCCNVVMSIAIIFYHIALLSSALHCFSQH